MTCPHCHQDAPSIVRGVRAYCTACGAPRSIVTAPDAVNVAGQPAMVGGGVAGVLGWVALVIGLTIALVVGGLISIFAATVALWVGGAIGVLTLVVSLSLILGGRRLRRAGEGRAQAAHEHGVFALAARRRGVLTAREVARSLGLREQDADALLTELARRPDGRVTLEVADDGALSYVFHDLLARVRVAAANTGGAPVPPANTGGAPAPPAASPPGRVIDAELIDDDADALARPPVRHALRY